MTIDESIYECPCGYGWDKSKVVRHHFCPNCGRAVNSTEQEPCDAVSRKEVMNMLHNHAFDYATSTKILALLKTMCGEVDRMPSVTPQYTEAEIQKMQELEQAEIQKAYELGKAEMQPCDDVCEWFEQYVDIATDIVELRFSDGTVKRARRGLYMRDIEKSIRKMLIDQIANEKKQEPKWIPVLERLPKTYSTVCATIKWDLCDLSSIAFGYYTKDEGWQLIDTEGNRCYDFTVIAWISLQPYKEGSDKE